MEISLYFHIPFCTKKCHYCHFYVIPDKDPFKAQWLEGIRLEWKSQLHLLEGNQIRSIYFGGGTPALIGPEAIKEILLWCQPYLQADAEITLEANPENISFTLMKAYREAGITRVSIGLQSLDDTLLKTLGRTHNSEKAVESVLMTREAGISNISVDLMYDLPGQSLTMWNETLLRATSLPISHISLYNLTIEPHTVFYKYRETIKKQIPSPELSCDLFHAAVDTFTETGFLQYEISAFAKNGSISQHNTGYWTGRPFLGFGPSAFSYWEGKRFRNAANLNRYVKALHEGSSPIDFEETLAPDAAKRELFTIRLRMMEGVPREDTLFLEPELLKLEQEGFLSFEKNRIKLTKKGILFYDHVAVELI